MVRTLDFTLKYSSMPTLDSPTVPVTALRMGLYVHLDLGWMDHPFPLSSFKITLPQQIEIIQGLGISQVRYSPERSDPSPDDGQSPPGDSPPVTPKSTAGPSPLARPTPERDPAWLAQRQAQLMCERQYQDSAKAVKLVFEQLAVAPNKAGEACTQLARDMVGQLTGQDESALRLLAEGHGDGNTLHAMNVAVLSLLLGRAMGMDAPTLEHLGAAALAHDVGKLDLPDRVRYRDDTFTNAHFKLHQEHVTKSVAKARRMGLSAPALLAIAQHHELADGTGFPLGLTADRIGAAGRVLALINRYDGLCNPPNPLKALTPHEALSLIFATMKERFERTTLNAFIRMMGVYPPGSVVQLNDKRYAMVISVNSARPLKPRVLVADPKVAREDALLLDLQQTPDIGIERSLRPDQLPRQALVYLSPRQRVCYFFERAVSTSTTAEGVA